jgi:alkaline phosphatase D
MRIQILFFLIILIGFGCRPQSEKVSANNPEPLQVAELDPNKKLTRIAFGSCNRENKPQRMWQYILENEPELWIWLGDNIYGDSEDMSVMKAKYDLQLSHPEYQSFLEACPVIGIWDDHDYGANDAGKEFPKKQETQQLMLDFLGVPEDAPQRNREGAYSAYTFGTGEEKVKILLLDARYFRDAPIKGDNGYTPNEEGTILGEAQWEWLEKELKESEATVHIIGNGYQILPVDHRFEKWANFPNERQRLIQLISDLQVKNPILLSGDRHIAEISKETMPDHPQDLYEITSSGLTHSYESAGNEYNSLRIGELVSQKNFGILHIDWSTNPISIRVEIRGEENQEYRMIEIPTI